MKFIYGVIGCFLASCSSHNWEDSPQSTLKSKRNNFGSVFKQNAILLKGKKAQIKLSSQKIDSVNKFLWNGALEVISFMPILLALPEQGVITTDWYSDEAAPQIRFRTAIRIFGKELRADAVKVYVQRQKLTNKRGWTNYHFSEKDCTKLEILIVERARKLLREFRDLNNQKDF